MRFVIEPTAQAASNWIARYLIERISSFQPSDECPFVLGSSTGEDCLLVLDELVKESRKIKDFSFQNVVLYCLYEYVELPRKHNCSAHSKLWDRLLRHVDFQPQNVNMLDGNSTDIKAECDQFEKLLESRPMDICLVDTGRSGEVGHNGSGVALTSRTGRFVLAHDTKVQLSKGFGVFQGLEKVPKSCITAGVGTIFDAKEVIAIVLGVHKASALEHCIERPINHMFPVSILQKHRIALIVADEDATHELRVATVKYFKGLQKTLPDVTRYVQLHPLGSRKRKRV